VLSGPAAWHAAIRSGRIQPVALRDVVSGIDEKICAAGNRCVT
jgi:hypothetical protein